MATPPPVPDIEIVGERRTPFGDLYHRFLRLSFPAALGAIVLGIVGLNLIFAVVYTFAGGVANASPGSFLDAFSFSMQTFATIGYGAMYPESAVAKVVSDLEAMTGLVVTALSTGLLFAKFAQPRGAILFTENAVITRFDGVPTLMFRVGNERGNLILEAQARAVLTRTEKTVEGETFYRMYDLALVRDRSINFTRSWTVMHRITPDSPLYDTDAARLVADEIEVNVTVTGVDDTSLQPVHGRRVWDADTIRFGYRLADMLQVLPDGRVRADIGRFHLVEPDGLAAPGPSERHAGAPTG